MEKAGQILTVYLCGPIQGCTDRECRLWRNEFARKWPFISLDPLRRDYRDATSFTREAASRLVEDDLQDIAKSDALVVMFNRPSVGTIMEVFYASRVLKLPVVVIDKSAAPLSPWLVHCATAFVRDVDHAISVLTQLSS